MMFKKWFLRSGKTVTDESNDYNDVLLVDEPDNKSWIPILFKLHRNQDKDQFVSQYAKTIDDEVIERE